jgi:hypothetical protein
MGSEELVEDTEDVHHALGERLVRVGPPLSLYQQSNRFGQPEPRWKVPRCGWVTRDFWAGIEYFQQPAPPLPPNFPLDILTRSLEDTKRWNQVPWAEEIERKMKLNPSRGVVWHVVARDGYDLVGFDAVLGEERLVPWTWLDANVGYPLLNALARIHNFVQLRVLEPLRRFFGFKPRFFY